MKPATLSAAMQAELLADAAVVLSAGPSLGYERPFRPAIVGRKASVRAVFTFPGIVRVFDAVSGELLAESAPGRPLDPQVHAKEKS